MIHVIFYQRAITYIVLNYWKNTQNKIDVIYIDPPYNRGKNDFVYDDKFINSDDAFKHSKWLSFIYERLVIAKNY